MVVVVVVVLPDDRLAVPLLLPESATAMTAMAMAPRPPATIELPVVNAACRTPAGFPAASVPAHAEGDAIKAMAATRQEYLRIYHGHPGNPC